MNSPYYYWNMKTGDVNLVDGQAQEEPEIGSSWDDALDDILSELNDWLLDPINVHDTVAAVENMLLAKHHDYGEGNLREFGEQGILVRASDKFARLKNLIDKAALVKDEFRADTWRDLAGYAIQALILMKMEGAANPVNVFENRKNRLIRGFCPDCGEGVLLRGHYYSNRLSCTDGCGFSTGDLYALNMTYPDFASLVDHLAGLRAFSVQK